MKSGTSRVIYDLVFIVSVVALAYTYRGLYQETVSLVEPIFQAYTPVIMLLIAITLLLLLSYLREAIAQTGIALYQKVSGTAPITTSKGSLPKNMERTAKRLQRKGDFQGAGETYESMELWRDAAIVYERGNLFGKAAAAWQADGNTSKAIELYEKDNNYEAAGNLCIKDGLQDRAAKNYRIAAEHLQEQNQFGPAAELYEKAHDFTKAAAVYEKAHKTDGALNCYEKAGDVNSIRRLLEKVHCSEFHRKGPDFTQLIQRCAEKLAANGFALEAAKILEECQDLIRAAEVSASCKLWDKAAELYLKAERPDLAEAAINNVQDKKTASDILARLAMAKGDWQMAGEKFEEAGKQNQAIDAYKKARNFDAAARIFESMGRYIMAGEMYSSGKSLTLAANAYAKAYDWRNAAECFEVSGDTAQAIESYANAGNYLKAGILAIKLTDYARAVEYLQRIPTGSPDYHMGTAFLATAFYYQSHHDMANELFSRVMDTLALNRDTLPVYYAYARNLETGNPKKSLALLRQILGIDVHYSDVSDRAHKLEQFITSITTGHGASTPTPAHAGLKQQTPLTDYSSSKANRTPFPKYGSQLITDPLATPIPSISALASPAFAQVGEIQPALLDGRYQLKEALNSVGRISDYNAVDNSTGKNVFVRTFPKPEDPAAYKKTMASLQEVSSLKHPGINSVIAVGETQGMIFTVCTEVGGQTLKHWIRNMGPMSIQDLVKAFSQVLNTLGFAHSQKISHLNLRPELIFLTKNLEERIVISGFGAPARTFNSDQSVYMTVPDSDPQFLAPEQIVGGVTDERTDMYAVGLLIFFALTGRTPFEVKRVNDTQEIARMQVQMSLTRPSAIRATLPTTVDDIFLKCVSKAPATRYQSAQELLNDLNQLGS